MKKHPLIFAIILGLILPWLLFSGAETFYHRQRNMQETTEQPTEPADAAVVNIQMDDGEIEALELEE